MKKEQLVKIIENVVRREVKKQVNQILIKEQSLSKVSAKKSKPIKRKTVKPVRREVKQYTSNSALNKILNETVGGIEGQKGNGEFDEYPDLGGGTFDSSKMAEALGYGEMMNSADKGEVAREMGAVKTIKEAGLSVEQVPENVVNAMTRDYSDLMKVINKGK
tara:strand:- start:73 stop:558 length:486 start_codon:yes stop_codon:yes gene_type:complete